MPKKVSVALQVPLSVYIYIINKQTVASSTMLFFPFITELTLDQSQHCQMRNVQANINNQTVNLVVIIINVVDIIQHNTESNSEDNSCDHKGDDPHNDTDFHHLPGAVRCRMCAYHVTACDTILGLKYR